MFLVTANWKSEHNVIQAKQPNKGKILIVATDIKNAP